MRRRPVIVSVLALSILALAVWALLFFQFLHSATPYCRVTPVSIQVDQKAHVTMEVALEHSSGTYWTQTYIVDGIIQHSGRRSGGSSSRFFPRPIRGGFTTEFDMDLEPDHGERSLKERATEAIEVKTGQTYLATPDEPLLLYRFKDEDGRIQEVWLEVFDHADGTDHENWIDQFDEKPKRKDN